MNAAKRFLKKLREHFPQLGLLMGGDTLFSKQPIIEEVLSYDMHYLFAAKPSDHKYMMDGLCAYEKLHEVVLTDEKGRCHQYEWMNHVPLNGSNGSIYVNFLRCSISIENKKGEEEIVYKNSWVSDILIHREFMILIELK